MIHGKINVDPSKDKIIELTSLLKTYHREFSRAMTVIIPTFLKTFLNIGLGIPDEFREFCKAKRYYDGFFFPYQH